MKALLFLLLFASVAFAVGGGGGGDGGGGSAGSSGGSGCAGLCELECLDNGGVRFLAANEIANITATLVVTNETFSVTGYWSFNRFTSDEVLFNKKGRYEINGYPVDCPGLKFSCLLSSISIDRCTKHNGYVEAEFVARNFDSLNKMKYDFFAGGKSFYYTSSLKSAQVAAFNLASVSNNTYLLNASISENIDRIQISDIRCAAKTVNECLPPTSLSSRSRTFVCYELETLQQRVSCRLALTEEQRYTELRVNFLPEECRALAGEERDNCINIYDSVQKCWKEPEGGARVDCVKGVIGFTAISREKVTCGSDTVCLEKLKKNAFTLVKFRFYDLEERAEELYEQNPELVAKIVSDLEAKKQEFNEARTIKEKKQIVLQVRQIWKNFIEEVKK